MKFRSDLEKIPAFDEFSSDILLGTEEMFQSMMEEGGETLLLELEDTLSGFLTINSRTWIAAPDDWKQELYRLFSLHVLRLGA